MKTSVSIKDWEKLKEQGRLDSIYIGGKLEGLSDNFDGLITDILKHWPTKDKKGNLIPLTI